MHKSDIFYTIRLDQHCIWSEMPNLTGRGPYQNATQFTSYTLFCSGTCITNEGLHTILVTCDLFPVVMMSFNTAAFLLLEPLINMHLTICHILFKTSCHINFNIKRFCLNRGCGTTAAILDKKVLRNLLFPTHRRPTLRIWHHGDPSPHPSLVNVV